LFLIEPKHHVVPQNEIAVTGDTVTFVCHSSIEVTWLFNGDDLPNNCEESKIKSGTSSYILTVQDVEITNAGMYECNGKTEHHISFTDEGQLKVIG